jgi:hypothetical protein
VLRTLGAYERAWQCGGGLALPGCLRDAAMAELAREPASRWLLAACGMATPSEPAVWWQLRVRGERP